MKKRVLAWAGLGALSVVLVPFSLPLVPFPLSLSAEQAPAAPAKYDLLLRGGNLALEGLG